MLARIRAIIRKEFIQILRDPRTLALALAMPVMQLLLFGYTINSTVDHIPMVVNDSARTNDSRDLVQALVNSTFFTLIGQVDSPAQAREAIDRGEAKVGLIIPPEFGRHLLSGEPADVLLLVDGSDPNTASTALLTAGQIAQIKGAKLAADRLQRLGGHPAGALIDLRPSVLYNPSMKSVNFMIPGLIGLILQTQAVMLTAFAIVRERERGTLEQLIVTPIGSWELLLGKILPFVIITFVQVLVALAVAILLFQVPFEGSLSLLMGLSLLFLVSSLGIGLLISTVSTTQGQAMQSTMFVLLPSILLSGFMFPRESMPAALQPLTNLIPLTYFLQVLRGIILKGNGLDDMWDQVIPLAIFGLVIFAISVMRFRKRLE